MISPDFSLFIHSLATELELQAGAEESDALLYSVGRRMADRLPLPACDTTAAFELECNANLALIGWGQFSLGFDAQKNALHLSLHDFPRTGALGKPAGTWLAGFYNGLITGWFSQMGETVKLRRVAPSESLTITFLVDAGT